MDMGPSTSYFFPFGMTRICAIYGLQGVFQRRKPDPPSDVTCGLDRHSNVTHKRRNSFNVSLIIFVSLISICFTVDFQWRVHQGHV